MFPFDDKEMRTNYIVGFARSCMQAGICLIQRPKITRGYIAITAPDTQYPFQPIKTFIREVISSLGWKRYLWFVKVIAKGGDNLETILRKQKRKYVIVQLLAIPEPYQHQDYMRQLMDFALQTAKSYDLPLVIETGEKLKCDNTATLA